MAGLGVQDLRYKQDPEKNYRNLNKAMAKLFKNYPPGVGKHYDTDRQLERKEE